MNKIYKYPFKIVGLQHIKIPEFYDVVTIGLDPNYRPCIWANVNPQNLEINVPIYVVGTGKDFPGKWQHLGSFVQTGFVWHVFTD